MDAPIGSRERFWANVEKTDSCWNWTGSKDLKGYGRIGGKMAHRRSYEWTNGPIPAGLVVDHICHNRGCVNPHHLRLATISQNSQNRIGAAATSQSGIRGVYWSAREGGWRADGTANGKRPYLGVYQTIEEAEAVVTAWRRQNMPYSLMDQTRTA